VSRNFKLRLLAFVTAALAAVLLLATGAALSHRAVKSRCADSPGGATDAFSRRPGPTLFRDLGQPVLVETAPAQPDRRRGDMCPSRRPMAPPC